MSIKKQTPLPAECTPSFHKTVILLIALVFLQIVAGCALLKKEVPVTRENAMKRLKAFAYPAFTDDMGYEGISDSIAQSISYLEKVPPVRTYRFGEDVYTADHMIRSLNDFRTFIETDPSLKELKRFIKKHYRVYQSIGSDDSGDVLFTGYYEPSLHGSLSQSDEFKYPLYARPDDLLTIDLSLFSPKYKGEKVTGRYTGQTVLPYYDRNEIDRQHLLEGNVAHVAWVKDPVDLFFLHIQGSGKILLADGRSINVHYHGANGRPYKSIGRLLIDTGKIEKSQMSMQKIRAYLHEYPEEVEAVLNYNPSYVFFKIEEDGPIGYLDVKLTPARSLAVDRRIFPLPALAFIETQKPLLNDNGEIHRWTDFTRFVVSQDTGGAIRGPGRADLFWGNGPYAETAAGHMQHPGNLYFLVLKPDPQ